MKATLNEPNGDQARWMRRSLLLCGLPFLLVAILAGCQHDAEAPADIDPAGAYTLLSIDGKEIPCTLTHGGHPMTVQSGVFHINSDGTCSSEVTFSVESGEEVSREVKATYTREGSTLTMTWEGAGMTTGMIEGDTFTMNNEGMVFLYQKIAGD